MARFLGEVAEQSRGEYGDERVKWAMCWGWSLAAKRLRVRLSWDVMLFRGRVGFRERCNCDAREKWACG